MLESRCTLSKLIYHSNVFCEHQRHTVHAGINSNQRSETCAIFYFTPEYGTPKQYYFRWQYMNFALSKNGTDKPIAKQESKRSKSRFSLNLKRKKTEEIHIKWNLSHFRVRYASNEVAISLQMQHWIIMFVVHVPYTSIDVAFVLKIYTNPRNRTCFFWINDTFANAVWINIFISTALCVFLWK